ncbi:ATP-binding cassette, subfamily B [Tenacibaculum sp. MAR_2009_124]|uniref:peptidase domain-containing ABC transporter n=1 Tax=Tenacibaculum sp. MAR_2009_124 TaxID=1250059 RepID=UPI00089C8C08|nr:peptidase domain-containing ABC transporter [Tenacibaculum sp. MAR_2009_124]SEC00893.1 ATP-binding cassette, subfamily B [Tenacibaculum sp. MAR_2009_124]
MLKLQTLLKRPYNRSKNLPFFYQLTSTDCAAACMCMMVNYFGKKANLNHIKGYFEFTRNGVSINDIIDASEKMGFSASVIKVTSEELTTIPFPVILYWKQDHFLVYDKAKQSNGETTFHLADPAYGKVKVDKESFENEWKGANDKGIAIVLQPTEKFDDVVIENKGNTIIKPLDSPIITYVKSFLVKNKVKYGIAIILLVISLIANWSIPFIFQKIIDEGVMSNNMNMVYFFLLSQVVLFISYFISDFFSRLILTKFNFSLSVNLKENLLFKLIKLPVSYFDTRLNTETLQRINDQNKIQTYMTWKGPELIISTLNILIFGSILLYYNTVVFASYFVLSVASFIWVFLFLKKRAVLEYAMFLKQSENSNHIYEFIMNMPEIKVNNAQKNVVNKITDIQKRLNDIELRSLYLNTYQLIGVNVLTKIKEIVAIGVCAYFIIESQITLGVLISISYVIGQLTGPMNNIISFVKDTQDAKLSNDRINDIYTTKQENEDKNIDLSKKSISDIHIKDLSFKYPGKFSPTILNDISFDIKKNTVTAIVGASGSGKTTLLKLLLSFYSVNANAISMDTIDMNDIIPATWRKQCGIVLQDGNIFSGSVAENITFSEENIDYDRLEKACEISCASEFIDQLPMRYNTKIGNSGLQLSGGQKQRILIARAVYKNPSFIFLDEATSALDAENEKKIYNNLEEFFKGRTVVVIAHRLSTVKNADNILVLNKGEIVEQGKHEKLVSNKGYYYNLIKNQLELGD